MTAISPEDRELTPERRALIRAACTGKTSAVAKVQLILLDALEAEEAENKELRERLATNG